jgi:uncharacterized protein
MKSTTVLLSGWWERQDRSLAAAAVTGLLVVGAIYFNGQAMLSVAVLALAELLQKGGREADTPLHVLRALKGVLLLIVMLTQWGLLLLPALFIVRRWHTRQWRAYIRLRAVGPLEILLPMLAGVAMIPMNLFVINFFLNLLQVPEVLREFNDDLLTAGSIPALLYLWLVIGVTPAICEEVFFRGYVQRTFERIMGWKSILLTGVLFGLYHMQPLGLFTLSLLGLLFGYYYHRSRSLIPGMVAHFTNNVVAVYLAYAKPVIGGVSLGTTSQIPIGWMPACIGMSAACIALFHLITRSNRREELLEKPQPAPEEIIAPVAPASGISVCGTDTAAAPDDPALAVPDAGDGMQTSTNVTQDEGMAKSDNTEDVRGAPKTGEEEGNTEPRDV